MYTYVAIKTNEFHPEKEMWHIYNTRMSQTELKAVARLYETYLSVISDADPTNPNNKNVGDFIFIYLSNREIYKKVSDFVNKLVLNPVAVSSTQVYINSQIDIITESNPVKFRSYTNGVMYMDPKFGVGSMDMVINGKVYPKNITKCRSILNVLPPDDVLAIKSQQNEYKKQYKLYSDIHMYCFEIWSNFSNEDKHTQHFNDITSNWVLKNCVSFNTENNYLHYSTIHKITDMMYNFIESELISADVKKQNYIKTKNKKPTKV